MAAQEAELEAAFFRTAELGICADPQDEVTVVGAGTVAIAEGDRKASIGKCHAGVTVAREDVRCGHRFAPGLTLITAENHAGGG